MYKNKKNAVIAIALTVIIITIVGLYFILNKKKENLVEEKPFSEAVFLEKIKAVDVKIMKKEVLDTDSESEGGIDSYTIMYDKDNKVIEIRNDFQSETGDSLVTETQYYIDGKFKYFMYIYDVIPDPALCMTVIGEVENDKVVKYIIKYKNKSENEEKEKYRSTYFEDNLKPDIKNFLADLNNIREKSKKGKTVEQEESSDEESSSNIVKKDEDINGDGETEVIELKEDEPSYLSLTVKDKSGKIIASINEIRESWYSPALEAGDIDGDGVSEIIMELGSGGSHGGSYYFLYKINGEKLEEMELPEDEEIDINLQEDKSEFYSKSLNKNCIVTYDSEKKSNIEYIKNIEAEEKQEAETGYVNEYKFLKENDSVKLCVNRIFFYGTNNANRCIIGIVSLIYEFENKRWNLKEIKEGNNQEEE